METIWFGSDWHINHKKICEFSKRPFESLELMRKNLLTALSSIQSKDTLIYLGDLWLSSPEEVRDFISVIPARRKVLIIGNHDHHTIKAQKLYQPFTEMYDLWHWSYQKQQMVICHYPLLSWNGEQHGSYMLHGHCHGNVNQCNTNNRRLDVGYDSTGKWIISLEEIHSILQSRPFQDRHKGQLN